MKEFTVPVLVKFSMTLSVYCGTFIVHELCIQVPTFEKNTTALSWLIFWSRLVTLGYWTGLARCEATGELRGRGGRAMSRGPDTRRGRAWSGPGPGGWHDGRPGEEEPPRTRGHWDHWPESECEETSEWRVATRSPDSAEHQDSVSNGSDKVRGGQQTQRGASCQRLVAGAESAWPVVPVC